MIAALGTALLLAQEPGASRAVRFEDLDRLYFQRVEGSAGETSVREPVRARLPPVLEGDGEASAPEGSGLEVRDFPLPAPTGSVLRQVVDRSNPRLAEEHWALYTDGRRTDQWFFSQAPAGKDGKALAVYEVRRVEATPSGGIVLVTCGSVFRPEGHWWWEGRNLHFVVEGDRLRFERVVTRFYASGGFDAAGSPLTVYDEREAPDGRIEVRTVDAVTKEAIGECRFPDPFTDAEASCATLEQAVGCLTARAGVRTTYRDRGIPSFIEKGGRPRGGS
jgi:hypothetical protein